jgi:hypothetical protein
MLHDVSTPPQIADSETISMPWLPRGIFRITAAVPSPTAPTMLLLTLLPSSGSHIQAASPVFMGSVASEIERLIGTLVEGAQESEEMSGDEDENRWSASVPDGTAKLWFTTITKQGTVYTVVAHMFTVINTVESFYFRLGLAKPAHCRKMARAIQGHLSNHSDFHRFLHARQWLTTQIEQRKTVWSDSSVGPVNNEVVVLVKNFSPALAMACLERNHFNRSVDPSHIGRLTVEIGQKNWTRGSENVCFDLEGHLIDGQHRVSGVILAGEPISTSIAFDHAKHDVKNMNAGGKKRSPSDNYDIIQRQQTTLNLVEEGDVDLRELPLGREFKQIIAKILYMETNTFKLNTPALQDAALVEYYDALKWIRPLARMLTVAAERQGSRARLADPMVLACFLLAYKKNPSETIRVVHGLLNNEGLGNAGTPLHTLGEVLTQYADKKGKVRNMDELPMSKRIQIALFAIFEGHEGVPMSVKNLEDQAKSTSKGIAKLRQMHLNYFKTELPEGHPARDTVNNITHSYLPSAVAEWRASQVKG